MPALVEPVSAVVPETWTANGCFETMRAYGGRIFRLEDHLDRLYASAQFLGTPAPADRRQLGRQLTRALQHSGVKEAVVRVALLPLVRRSPAAPERSPGFAEASLGAGRDFCASVVPCFQGFSAMVKITSPT